MLLFEELIFEVVFELISDNCFLVEWGLEVLDGVDWVFIRGILIELIIGWYGDVLFGCVFGIIRGGWFFILIFVDVFVKLYFVI